MFTIVEGSRAQMRLRVLMSTAALLFVTISPWTSSAFAAGVEPFEPAARWPMVLAGVVVLVVGLVAMGLRYGWTELSPRLRVLRGVGVVVASLGVFLSMYGLTEAPPRGMDDGNFTWWTSMTEAESVARELERPLMLDFTADWCVACAELEAEVFYHPEVKARLEAEFVSVKIDFDRASETNDSLLDRFSVHGLPTVLFVTPGGELLEG